MKKMKMSASNDQNLYLEIDVKKLDCPSSNLKPRREIGSYSLDIEKKVENSRRCLKYFIKPPNPENVNFDLKKGYDTRIIKPHGNDFHILSWMKENMDKFPRPDQDNQRNSEFVCRRGVIAKIMLTPYEEFEEWCVAVTLYKGTYYMQEIIPEKRRESDENLRDDEMACWGWKFEQYLTADRKDGKPNTDIPYNNCEAFYSVVETGIKNHSLVLCCEIDAIDTDDNYIELKITKEQSHEGHVKTFKKLEKISLF